jgi:hypothetical protein
LWDIGATLLSLLSFGAIIGILAYFDGRRLPYLGGGLTLNGLIAATTAVARAAVLVPVSSGIGQLKWVWLAERHRILKDVDEFDEASRGPWGSVKLIWRMIWERKAT